MEGYIHSTESFGSVDGPGVRFIIFLSGCPLRCKFCHNPDTWDITRGKKIESGALLAKALRYRPYWKDGGGITVSGGEPLLQLDFVLELFTKAKELGVSTCIDTAGSPFTRAEPWFSKFKDLMTVTDLLLVDIKHINEDEHVKLTGKTGKNIIDMLGWLSDTGKPVWIRHVLIPGITDNDDYLIQTRDYIRTLKNVQRVDVLPYHTLGIIKYRQLGMEYPLEGVDSPSKERILNAKRLLEADSYTGWKGE